MGPRSIPTSLGGHIPNMGILELELQHWWPVSVQAVTMGTKHVIDSHCLHRKKTHTFDQDA
jgi:hypothetical protein